MSEIVEDLKIANLEITNNLGIVFSAENSGIYHDNTGEFEILSKGSIKINTQTSGDDILLLTQENDSVVIPYNLDAGKVHQAYDPQSEPTGPYALLVPTGAIMPYAGAAAPGGWLLCNGAGYNSTTYPTLYAVITTTYGTGSGVGTNFNVPNLCGRVPLGAGANAGAGLTTRTLATTGGQEAITKVPPHTHDITDPSHTHSYVNNTTDQGTDNIANTETAADNADNAATTGASTTGITVNNTGTNIQSPSVDVMNPFLVLNYIIKV
jgi:microcystin-dependent protein